MPIATEQQITEWLLNADQHIGELKKVYKEYQAQERQEKQLDVIRNKLSGTTNELTSSLSMATIQGNLLFQGLMKGVEIIKQSWSETDRYSKVLRNYSGDIDKATESIGNDIKAVDIMTTRNKLMGSGIALLDEQWINLLKSSKKYADNMGREALPILEEFTNALVTATDRGMRKYGIELDKNLTLDQKRQAAMDQYIKRAEKIAEVDGTVTDGLGDLGTALSDCKVQILDVINRSELLNSIVKELAQSFEFWKNEINATMPEIHELKAKFLEFGISVNSVLAKIPLVKGLVSPFIEVQKSLLAQSKAEYHATIIRENAIKTTQRMNREMLEYARILDTSQRKPPKKPPKNGKALDESLGMEQYRVPEMQFGQPAIGAEGVMQGEYLEKQRLAEIAKIERQIAEDIAARNVAQQAYPWLTQDKALQKYTTTVEKFGDLWGDTMETYQSIGTQAIESVSMSLMNGIRQMIETADFTPMIFLKTIADTAWSLSQQLLIKGIAAQIEANALASNIFTAWMAPGFYAQSATYLAGAATIGAMGLLGSVGIGLMGGGGGGGKGAQTSSHGGGGGDVRYGQYEPGVGKKSEEKEKKYIFNIYFGDPDDPSAILMSKKQIKALAA